MSERTTTLRLRSVRFKDGRGSVRVMPHRKSDSDILREKWAADVPQMMRESKGRVEGFAVMIWGSDGSTVYAHTDGSIPSILVPDFVRNRLLASRIEAWTIDTINGK